MAFKKMIYVLREFKEFEAVFLNEQKSASFLIKWNKIDDYHASFVIFTITAWEIDDNPCEWEKYIDGSIKWDGCSHFVFGEDDNLGYLHLCGKGYFDAHCNIIHAIWDICSKRIGKFDNNIAS